MNDHEIRSEVEAALAAIRHSDTSTEKAVRHLARTIARLANKVEALEEQQSLWAVRGRVG